MRAIHDSEPVNRALDAILIEATPMVWNTDHPYMFFLHTGEAPDPLGLGYSRKWGSGLGLHPSQWQDSLHHAMFWAQGGKRPRFCAWLGKREPSSNTTAHERLQRHVAQDAVNAGVEAFRKRLLVLPDVRALLTKPTAKVAVAFPTFSQLTSAPVTIHVVIDGHKTEIRSGKGVQRPYQFACEA